MDTDADRHQIVDVEEATIVDLVRGHAPEAQPVRLPDQEGLQRVEAPRIALPAVQVGQTLVAKDGAEVIVMGCAGMARHRRPLEDALGVPVIDPTQAAVTMAIGVVQTQLG